MFETTAPFRYRPDWRYEAAWNCAEEHGSIMGGHPLSFFRPIPFVDHQTVQRLGREMRHLHRVRSVLMELDRNCFELRVPDSPPPPPTPEQRRQHQANQRRRDVKKQACLGRKAELRAQKSALQSRGRDRR